MRLWLVRLVLVSGACADLPADGLKLKQAAFAGDIDKVRELLSVGADPNARSGATGTALADAAAGGHRDVVRLLLAADADPNLASDSGYTPLSAAASIGAEAIIADLLAAGANVNAVDVEYKNTALHTAARRGHQAAVQRPNRHRNWRVGDVGRFSTAMSGCAIGDPLRISIPPNEKMMLAA